MPDTDYAHETYGIAFTKEFAVIWSVREAVFRETDAVIQEIRSSAF